MKHIILLFLGIVLFCAETMGQSVIKTLEGGTKVEVTNDAPFGGTNVRVIKSPDYNPQYTVCFEAGYQTSTERLKACVNSGEVKRTGQEYNNLLESILTSKLNNNKLATAYELKNEIIYLYKNSFSEEKKIWFYKEKIKSTSSQGTINKYDEKIKESQNIIANNEKKLEKKRQNFDKIVVATREATTKEALENCDCSEEEKQIKINFMNKLEEAEEEIKKYSNNQNN